MTPDFSSQPARTLSRVRAEDVPIGPYVVELTGQDNIHDTFEHAISVEVAESLVDHLQRAIKMLRRRQTVDAVCGDCEKCGNVRMVDDPPSHVQTTGQWLVHCPVCRPKIEEAEKRGLL